MSDESSVTAQDFIKVLKKLDFYFDHYRFIDLDT